jgi:hypothetical protein
MSSQPTALERAFELARSGRVTTMTELRLTLKAERFALTQVSGPSLTRQLTTLMREATRTAADAASASDDGVQEDT